jgi:tetratricopeptide (TPR) repeat protein
LTVETSTVARWEAGISEPLPHKRPKLGRLLGLTAAQLESLLAEGDAPTAQPDRQEAISGDASLVYASSLRETLSKLNSLVCHDDNGGNVMGESRFAESASVEAILSWMVSAAEFDLGEIGASVSEHDVEEVETTTMTLDHLDRRFGGEYSRELAVKYLRSRVLPMLHGPCVAATRRDLFQATSVLCEFIGYIAYDGQRHGMAQRYFVQALRLAREAGSAAYGAFVLNTMSHQELYLDRPEQALLLARAAQRDETVAPVAAEAAMLEATAYSVLGNHSAGVDALSRAERFFERDTAIGERPYWSAHWDQAVFSSFAGAIWINLGDVEAAQPHLDVAWERSEGQVRRRVFAAGQLAKAALLEHDVERCAHYGMIAAEAASVAKSKRSQRVVRDMLKQLSKHRELQMVCELRDRVLELLPDEAS